MALYFRPAWESAMYAREARQRAALIYRLICNGSDSLVFQVCRRLEADRARLPGAEPGEPLGWPEIVGRAKREGLLQEREAQVLLRDPTGEPVGKTA